MLPIAHQAEPAAFHMTIFLKITQKDLNREVQRADRAC